MPRQHLGRTEEIVQLAHAQQARTPERSVVGCHRRPAKAPVCESAALAPVALRPALTTMTGLDLAARRAADMNFGACVTDSI